MQDYEVFTQLRVGGLKVFLGCEILCVSCLID